MSGYMICATSTPESRRETARARLALEIFCYRVLKYAGAYAAVMGGVDAIVFTGGTVSMDSVQASGLHGLSFWAALSRAQRSALRRAGDQHGIVACALWSFRPTRS